MLLLFSSYLYRCVTASYETLWQRGETRYCDVKTHPSNRCTIMKEPARFIGYAIWISIGCHASFPIRRWQAVFSMYMQSVIWHRWVLMKRIKYEESYIQTDGKCNFRTRQLCVERFLYWFLIRLNWDVIGRGLSTDGTSQIILRIVRAVEDSVTFTVTGQLWLFELSCSWFSSQNNKKKRSKGVCGESYVKVFEWVSLVQGSRLASLQESEQYRNDLWYP